MLKYIYISNHVLKIYNILKSKKYMLKYTYISNHVLKI